MNTIQLWIVAAIVAALALAGTYYVGYTKGAWAAELEYIDKLAEINGAHIRAQGRAAEAARKREKQLRDDFILKIAEKDKEIKDVQTTSDRTIADLRLRVKRLSVPVIVKVPVSAATGDASATGFVEREERAELSPSAAADFEAIGRDADIATIERNQCVDLYNTARDKLNEHARETGGDSPSSGWTDRRGW